MITFHRWGLAALAACAISAASAANPQDAMEAMRKRYGGRQPGLDAMSSTPEEHGLEFEPFAVENPENTLIVSWWIPAESARATAVMVHGFNMNKSHMLTRAKVLVEAGVNVALVDLRARGESGGERTSPGPEAATDVSAVLTRVRGELSRELPVLLYGFSHGARTILFAAQQDGEHPRAPLVAVIAEAPPFSLRESFKRKMNTPFAPPIPEGDLVASCAELAQRAMLVLVGDKDADLRAEQALQLVPGPQTALRRVKVFANTGHGVLTSKTEAVYGDTIHDFIRALLEPTR